MKIHAVTLTHGGQALSLMFLILVTAFGGGDAQAQNYPPAVVVSGLPGSDSAIMLSGSDGTYSGGYYYSYSIETPEGHWDYNAGSWVTHDEGYWDNSTGSWDTSTGYWDTTGGHWDTSTGYWDYTTGYWDNSTGYYDSEANWVSSPTWVGVPTWVGAAAWVTDPTWVSVPTWMSAPTWVAVPTEVWVTNPVWVNDGSSYSSATAWMACSLSITAAGGVSGNVLLSTTYGQTGSTDQWSGSYDFADGGFTGTLPEMGVVNTDGSAWTPPPYVPVVASFGPAALWIDGTVYSWSYSTFDNEAATAGSDFYSDSSGHYSMVSSTMTEGVNTAGTTPAGQPWTGLYADNVFESLQADVRAVDQAGCMILATPPTSFPQAMRVAGSGSLWRYLGGTLHTYAGEGVGERATLTDSGVVSVNGAVHTGLYVEGVVWTPLEVNAVRAVSAGGTLQAPTYAPAYGPADVWVNGTVWRFAGTWTSDAGMLAGTPPLHGDHYLGENADQEIVIDPSGSLVMTNLGATTLGSWSSSTATFNVAGATVLPGDANGAYVAMRPTFGPPAILANTNTFQFMGTVNASDGVSSPVDSYSDGTQARIKITANTVTYTSASGGVLWSGVYVPTGTNPADGGVFVPYNGSGLITDLRAANGGSVLRLSGTPLTGHPATVKADDVFMHYAGATAGTNPVDYYLGPAPGQWLWIDSTGYVAFSQGVSSHSLTGTGMLLGNVFLAGNGHDLRACTADNLATVPMEIPQWGPPAIWVEGVPWSYIGVVSNDDIGVHADFYGGLNKGQVLRIDNDHHVSGSYTGSYINRVFVTGDADIRALSLTGLFLTPATSPGTGHPLDLRIGGLHWEYLGTVDGFDYYAADQAGQRLRLAVDGSVVYSDRPDFVSGATGIYNSNGTFTLQNGGISFNAGTIGGDLDILGDVLSLGSHLDDKNLAGLSIEFRDDLSQPGSPASSVAFTISRALASWSWSRAGVFPQPASLPQMTLDAHNRLTLYDPASASMPAVVIDPSGLSHFTGGIFVEAQGGVSMGAYTSQPQQ